MAECGTKPTLRTRSDMVKDASMCSGDRLCSLHSLFGVVRSMGSIEGYKGGHSRGVAINSFEELPQDGDGLEVERPRDINELDRAQAPFAAFVFGDKGLRLVEPRGDINLRQAALLAKVAQQLAELDLARRAQRVAH